MANASPLPKKLRLRLAELGLRLHRQHMIQGLCRIVLIAILTAAAAVLLDAWITFPGWLRGLLFAGWLLLGVIEIRRFWLGPFARPLDAQGLASAIEQEYPRLGERLTTAVELAGSTDPANGSPELIDLVVRDAETRTRRLDINRAAPATATIAVTAAGIATILAVLIPLVAVPRAAEHARRFLAPWYAPKADAFTINVTSGDPTVKRGESTTLSALIEPTRPNAVLPTTAAAAIRTEKGIEMVPLTFDIQKREAYSTLGPLEEGFDYQIVCGSVESGWRRVTVVDPVRLESSRLLVNPPPYARTPGHAPIPSEGFAEVSALQYSRITYELHFNRLPSAAWLEWKPDGDDATADSRAARINVPIAEDASASVTVPAIASGEYRLIAEADKLRTTFPPQRLTVLPDAPPRFEKQEGVVDRPLQVRPNDKLQIDGTVADDVAVAKVELEYRINDRPAQLVLLPFKGADPKQVSGRFTFELDGKMKEGDKFYYRLVATDNRSLPEAKLTPQQTYYPENGKWAELNAHAGAAPLKEQDIIAKRDELENRLRQIIDALKVDQRATYRLKIETAKLTSLHDEQAEKLNDLQKDVRKNSDAIEELARDIALTPDLASLAGAVRDIGEHEVLDADRSLRQAQREAASAGERTKELAKADRLLEEAIRKFEALRKDNERAANDRLDKLKLGQIAHDQEKLAQQTPKSEQDKLDEIQRQQKELEDRFRKLLEDSAPLRNALEKLRAAQFEQTAAEAQRLEQELRDLTEAMKKLESSSRDNRLADLRRRQDELAVRANELAARTAAAARSAPLSPLKSQEIVKAAEALKNGDLNDAVNQQERAVLELDRLARELHRAVARSRDPREAARQLERLQEDLRQSVRQATEQVPLAQLPRERRDAFEKQQAAIRNAAEKLSVPQEAADAKKARQAAIARAAAAVDSLNKSDAAKTDEQMAETRKALGELAERLPTQEKRLAQARTQVAKLRQEQDAIARQAEQTASFAENHASGTGAQAELAKKLADQSRRQAQLLEKLNKLDTPGHEERRDKVEESLRQAQSDLEAGRPQDVAASQPSARRQLERLEQALNGQVPADEQADKLAEKQRQLAAELKKNAAQPEAQKLLELRQLQAEMTAELQKLQVPEAPATREAAIEQSHKAEGAKGPDEAASLSEEAARAIQTLADQVNGREREAARAARLARRQQEAADEADRLAKKKESTQDLRKKSLQMLDETKTLRAGVEGQKERQRAVESLNRVQQASNPELLARAEKEAAEALRQLASRLSQQPVAEKPEPHKEPMEGPEGLASTAQADEARRLADEQRQIRDELARAHEEMTRKKPVPEGNPLAELVKEQEKIAKESGDLARELEQAGDKQNKSARQAADAAKLASSQLKNGLVEPAKEAGQQSAQKLEQLAQGDPKSETGKRSQGLALRQEEINKKLAELGRDSQGGQAQQAERQMELQQRIDNLNEKMEKFTLEQGAGAGKAKDAADMGRQAGESMKDARERHGQGERGMVRDVQEKAADALQQAARDLQGAARQMSQDPKAMPDQAGQDVGPALGRARDEMSQAQDKLGQGRAKDAGQAMQAAADALNQAQRQMGRPGPASSPKQPPKSGDGGSGDANDGTARGAADLSQLGLLGEKFKGKSWGELPGEIKNQIISDMKARYGEDYARYIKLYFEQLAERK